MAGVEGFEPSKWRSQSPMPYHLATPQYSLSYHCRDNVDYYITSKIAVFGFMNPVCGVLLSALLLGEAQEAFRLESLIALVLVSAGIFIVNKMGEKN